MGTAFGRAVYVFSFRCAFPGGRTADTLFPMLYKTRVQAQLGADDVPNWSSQKAVELTIRLYHPDQEDGDQGMPTAMWRRELEGGDVIPGWFQVPPLALADLADAGVRTKLEGTLKR